MNKGNNIKNHGKKNLLGLVLFFFSTALIAAGYLTEALFWEDTLYVTAQYAWLFTGICMLLLILASLVVSLFFKRLSIEKRFLLDLGFITIAFGITGITGLVFENNISFVDALYKTFQLFVGEFGDISYKTGSFPLLLNISRFLALFVTFGAIAVLVLKEKITQLNIKLFYRDVVIITDCLDKRITALADKLCDSGRRIVIGIISPTQKILFKSNDQIPVIEFDVDKTLSRGLSYCNISKAKCIYLFCNNTSDNIVLFSAVSELYKTTKKQNKTNKREGAEINEALSESDTLELLYASLENRFIHNPIRDDGKQRRVKCFIQYKNYSEKEYYSIDSSLSGQTTNIETYFINPDINALRQMISGIDLRNLTNLSSCANANDLIIRMNNIRIGIAGSGNLLESAAYEIPRLCSFSASESLDLYFLGEMSDAIKFKATLSNSQMSGAVKVHEINLHSKNLNIPALDLLFICSESEMHIKSIIHSVFQLDLYKHIKEILILTEGNRIEFDILQKYISNLAGQFPFIGDTAYSSIYLGNTVELIMSIDDFYSTYGPDIHSVHEAYQKSISNGLISDFGKLPEELIESNLLTSIHNHLILGMLSSLFPEATKDKISISEFNLIIDHLAAVEHERWYRERLLQGYILSDSHDYLLNKNPFLKHWSLLDDDMKKKNKLYLLKALKSQHDRQIAMMFDVYIPNVIKQLRYSFVNGGKNELQSKSD